MGEYYIKKRNILIILGMIIIILSFTNMATALDTDNTMTDNSQLNDKHLQNVNQPDTQQIIKTKYNTTKNLKSDSKQNNTFTALDEEIRNSKNEINITQDYLFNKEFDRTLSEGINITNTTLTINGNNHTINAIHQARLFNIKYSNLVINDLKIVNANKSAILLKNSTLTTNNVIFENNIAKDNGGAINGENSTYNTFNDSFINNYAKYGSAIFLDENSTLSLSHANLKSNTTMYWGLIELRSSKFSINHTNFTDMKSKYTTAIHAEDSSGNITNCTFKNLEAMNTAGALAFKEVSKDILIKDSIFDRDCSLKNAGALYVDIDGGNSNLKGRVIIRNSKFNDCTSSYGGAVMQLGGLLDVYDTVFIENHATGNGGALYTSFTNLTINNSTFSNNTASNDNSLGGAAYFDAGFLHVNNTSFTSNDAIQGGAIYIYDSQYNISNSYFSKNVENIHSLFDGKTRSLSSNNFVDGKNMLNQEEYLYVYEGEGAHIDYNPIIFDESMINASKFDLREYGLVSPVKDQGWMGCCWTFGTSAAIESALLKASNGSIKINISENNIRNSLLKYSIYGIDTTEGSGEQLGSSYFLSWRGVTSGEDDTYDELGKISPKIDDKIKYHILNMKSIKSKASLSDNYYFKEALVKYGALVVGVYSTSEGSKYQDYNNKTHAAYLKTNKSLLCDHVVTLVGWDDNYSKENFLITPPDDGAWIIKNSWGKDWGDNGYYYLSYYDSSAFKSGDAVAFIIDKDSDMYEKIYQWDMSDSLLFKGPNINVTPYINYSLDKLRKTIEKLESESNETFSYANIYESIDNDLIAAIGTYFKKENVNYTFNIKVGDKIILTQTGNSSHEGFETIKLKEYVPIKKGETFIINMTTKYIPVTTSRQKIKHNHSLSNYDGKWGEISSEIENFVSVAALKAYTIQDNSYINITDTQEQIKAVYYGARGEKLVNTPIQYKINGKTYTSTTDENATLYINLTSPHKGYIITIINPVNKEERNISVASNIKSSNDIIPNKDNTPRIQYTKNNKKLMTINTHKIFKNNQLIYTGNLITLKALQSIFNETFINGHLLIYIDGKLVYNNTVNDDPSTILLKIIESLLGEHEIRVEFTDNNNITHNYTEQIIIK